MSVPRKPATDASAGVSGALATGMAALKAGHPKKAEAVLATAFAASPGHIALSAALATVRNLLHSHESARFLCEAALRHSPGHPVLLTEMGHALAGLGKTKAARRAYQQALQAAPQMLAAAEGLGRTAFATSHYDLAVQAWQRVLAVRPDHVTGALQLGHALRASGDPQAALEAFAHIPKSDQLAGEAAYGRGCALLNLGRIKEARDAFTAALKCLPDSGRCHRMLAALKTFVPDDPQLAAMEKLAETIPSLPEAEQIELHFALGKALEDTHRYADSFAHYQAGNALKKIHNPYDEAGQLALFQRIIDSWPQGTVDFSGGCDSTLPVFIIGMPRAGSSLLEQMLAAHPDVYGAGETLLFAQALKACGIDPQAMTAIRDPALKAQVGSHYVHSLAARGPQAGRIVDKMPGNFLYAGLICQSLPRAKMIHIRRDAMDCCFSAYATLFSHGHHYACDLTTLGRYYQAYEGLMTHWRRALPQGTLLEVDYETLVKDPVTTLKQVLAFCGLSWNAACLDFIHTRRTVMTASAAQVRRPLYRHSIGRAVPFKTLLGTLEAELGKTTYQQQ